jgi:fumarylacetoacetase
MDSLLHIPDNSDFTLKNLPFGIFKNSKGKIGAATILGDTLISLSGLQKDGYLSDLGLPAGIFDKMYLNDFIALGKPVWKKVREKLIDLFAPFPQSGVKVTPFPPRGVKDAGDNAIFFNISEVEMLMPIQIGNYTDFYSSREHATNVGSLFRDPKNALLPNWLHLPVAYHGRASSIMVSGHSFHRPKGQYKPPGAENPVFGPTKALDFELETAFVIGQPTEHGASVSTKDADDYIFGMVLFNDWSARDIQSWEYVPLGPFLGKNFASTISPWIVTMDALEPYRIKSPVQVPEVLSYLKLPDGNYAIDINLEVWLKPSKGKEIKLCTSNFRNLYWTMEQQLAHHTVNGCNINVGDLMASGTISGSTPDSYGSMLEITRNGANPLLLEGGEQRKFLEDGDTIILKGFAGQGKERVGFGEARATVLPPI